MIGSVLVQLLAATGAIIIAVYLVSEIMRITSFNSVVVRTDLFSKQRSKILLSVFLFVLVSFGFWQSVRYYLFSGAYFWYTILSFGVGLLVYVMPFSAVVLPIRKDKKSFGFKHIFGLSFCNSFTLFWAIILLTDRSTLIYEDEGGVKYHYGNSLLKLGGGISYLIVISIVIMVLAMRVLKTKDVQNK